MDAEQKKVLDRLQSQCSRREYCTSDIRRKALAALGGDAARAGEVVESLLSDRFVSDLRYAAAFARDKAHLGGWGPVKIRYALSGKGISQSDIAAALQEIEPDAASGRLEKLMAAKAKALEGDPQARLKLIRFALSRGYEYDEIKPYL
ncbi:MAG: RecX family transcriptional regulator [Bacteroidales bacterium]|nr:RecX family transcriptional regulator [Bacteroidales bacterium]